MADRVLLNVLLIGSQHPPCFLLIRRRREKWKIRKVWMAQAIFFFNKTSLILHCVYKIYRTYFFFYFFYLLSLKGNLNNLLFLFFTPNNFFVIYSPFPWVHCNALLLDAPITWKNLSHFTWYKYWKILIVEKGSLRSTPPSEGK